jgi:hypothetical protein
MKQKKNPGHTLSQKRAISTFLKLSKYVRDRKVTQALILLEQHGIEGYLATFLIGVIQSSGEVKHDFF